MEQATQFSHDNVNGTGDVSLKAIRRSDIKLSSTPNIVICVPVGTKHYNILVEDENHKTWQTSGFMAQSLVPVMWAVSNMQLVPPLNSIVAYSFQFRMLSAQARQIMTMDALKTGCKYILYWDDDVMPPPLGLYTLFNFMETHPEAGAVSGVYVTKQNPSEPLIYKEHGKGAHWNWKVGGKPEEIFSCGAGFILARADAIRAILDQNPGVLVWADEQVSANEDAEDPVDRMRNIWGHDVRFCMLLQNAGHKVYFDPRVLCGHMDIESNLLYELPLDSPPYKKE